MFRGAFSVGRGAPMLVVDAGRVVAEGGDKGSGSDRARILPVGAMVGG